MVRINEQSRNVHQIKMERGAGFEQWFLLSSDHHIDNPKAQRDKIFKHLKQAQERNAQVFMFGDVFCLMQGKGDPRGNKNDILPQHNTATYIDSVINETVDLLGPYADNIALISPGNHESSVLKHRETNPTERLIQGINTKYTPKDPIKMGGYSGYIRFMFSRATGSRSSVKLYYEHGYGGGGEVSKGIIQSQRRAVYCADAHIVVSGHVHDHVISEWVKVKCNDAGKIEHFVQHHVILPSYKEEYGDGYGGYHKEKGRQPKPTGAVWLRFFEESDEVKFELIRAH